MDTNELVRILRSRQHAHEWFSEAAGVLEAQAARIAELEAALRAADETLAARLDTLRDTAERASSAEAKVARLREAAEPILNTLEAAFPALAKLGEFKALRAALQDTQP
jgi:phage-related tail protein